MDDIRESRLRDELCCPYCEARAPFKINGTYKGRQGFLCQSCKRIFNDLTNTPIHRTHYPDQWVNYLAAMEQGLTIRKCTKRAGISVPTTFTWRHIIPHGFFRSRISLWKALPRQTKFTFVILKRGV
ncbi:transposase [Paenibacillus sp. DMB20]|uniref:transposase n=1 Tax=Paenibacillus sp. DMB20 TaxID=1642570 RepID=UPI003FA603B3